MCDNYNLMCKERFDKLDKSIDEINKRLFKGNGSPPFDIQLAQLSSDVSSLKNARSKWRDRVYAFVVAIILLVIGAFIKTHI